MSDLTALLGQVVRDEAYLAQNRAAGELRAGRPLVIAEPSGRTLIAALDGASPSLFDIFLGLPGANLALTAQRARMMGVAVDDGVAIPLRTLDLPAAKHLACDPRLTEPEAWQAPTAAALAAIGLAKQALLLPAILVAPLAAEAEIPAGVQTLSLADAVGESAAPYDLEIVSQAPVPMAGGIDGRFVVFRGGPVPRDQVAIVVGDPDPEKPVLVRAHSSCLTGDLFGSLRCDCGDQLKTAMRRLSEEGGGVLLYLDQEGRGIGIGAKMRAYALQDDGFDTIDADAVLGFSSDERRYEYAASMLLTLGYRKIVLLTNNPEKIGALTRAGVEVVDRRPLYGGVNARNRNYLKTKQNRAQHMLDGLLDQDEATGTDGAA